MSFFQNYCQKGRLSQAFEDLKKKFRPPPLFILSKNYTHLVYSTHAYYFSSGNFLTSTIIPATLNI